MKVYNKSERIVRNRKIMLLAAIIASLLFGFILFSNRAAAETNRQVYTYYTSYEIQPGDTLWSIADQFMGPDYTDKQDFISNIKSMNHLLDDDITAGNYLVIEYSSYDML
ncbi:LysM peptidoglycan-binding domain-containing protein [Pseudobutyrivibrio sp. LB2011]|uniref:LysM peptidoglycan-binding domain-containing protein n=1 Tax=Pseudobutyrivibrio sp. LB2011 TaxID=1408312 RepID=UPI000678E0B1|nr:LysM peptidoglycan-binding domain-containing protein [Pseudobutyrivibrio sp. LB2011]